MSIDETTIWAALLCARGAWRPGGTAQSIDAAAPDGARVTLNPDATWHSTAELEPPAHNLLEVFLPIVARPRIVLGQLGQSLDGRIATARGHSHYVTGPQSLVHLHRLRALMDGVVIGAGTLAADDPRLTVRHCGGENPLRIVLDPTLRNAMDRHMFSDGQAPSLVICDEGRARPMRHGAADIATLPAGSGGFAPRAVLDLLAARGITRVLVEGGGLTVSGFLAAGALDVLHIVVAPILIGSGRQGITLPEIATLDDALRPPTRRHMLGDDVLFDLRFT